MPDEDDEKKERTKKQGEDSNASGYAIILMRHGIAIQRDVARFADDAKRPLTPDGKKRVREIARGLIRLGVKLDWVVTSPLARAIETAEIVADAYSPPIPLDFCDALRPGASAPALIQFLSRRADRRHTLAVGHEPDFSAIAAYLIGAGPRITLAFKKGGCCLIAFDEFPLQLPGRLVWWLPPRVLRRIS